MRPEGVKGTTSHKKGFELGFAPTPEAPNHSFRPGLFFVALAKSTPMAECSREPSTRNIWCLAPILCLFVKGGARKSTPPGGHRLVSRKKKLAERKSYESIVVCSEEGNIRLPGGRQYLFTFASVAGANHARLDPQGSLPR